MDVPSDGYEATGGGLLSRLPALLIVHHVLPLLPSCDLRAWRLVSKACLQDAASRVTTLRRFTGTHLLPPDLGSRFPALTHLELASELGGLSLARALSSAPLLRSLNLSACPDLPGSFIASQLPPACPLLESLALACNAAPPATEDTIFNSLSRHLAPTLTSLDLTCSTAFQPDIQHLTALTHLRRLRITGCRTLYDDALPYLSHLSALTELSLHEQHSRRGRHITGEGFSSLSSLPALASLNLSCHSASPRHFIPALASLTQIALSSLDLSRCDPTLLEHLAPLTALGSSILHLSLPSAYLPRQAAGAFGVLPGLPHLRSVRLTTTTQLPAEAVGALARLSGLQEVSISHSGRPGSDVGRLREALSGLRCFHLVQEHNQEVGDGDGEGGGEVQGEGGEAEGEQQQGGLVGVGQGEVGVAEARRGRGTWYDAAVGWSSLRDLVVTDTETMTDEHLCDMGARGTVRQLSYFSLSRSARVTGRGLASWGGPGGGCSTLRTLVLYDCAAVQDEALTHIARLPLHSLSLMHLPAITAHGVRQLAGGCTTLRQLAMERLSGVAAAGFEPLWTLPQLQQLALRFCDVTNLTLQPLESNSRPAQHQYQQQQDKEEEEQQEQQGHGLAAAGTGSRTHIGSDPHGASTSCMGQVPDCKAAWAWSRPRPLAPCLRGLELQGTLVTTAGLRALRGAAGLTALNLNCCRGVGDGVADVLLLPPLPRLPSAVSSAGDEAGRPAGATGAVAAAAAAVAAALSSIGVSGGGGGGGCAAASEISAALRGLHVGKVKEEDAQHVRGGCTGGDGAGAQQGAGPGAGARGGVRQEGEGRGVGTVRVLAGDSAPPPRLLLPCLVALELHGCAVSEAAVERLRVAGLAVNVGPSWR